MSKAIMKVENLLWLTPVLFCLFYTAFIGNSAIDLHFNDTYFIIEDGVRTILFYCLIVMAIPFGLHLFLRYNKRWNKTVCTVHVIASIVLVVGISVPAVFQQTVAPFPKKYYGYTESLENSFMIERWIAIALVLFIVIQASFVLFAIIAFFKKSQSN